MGRFFHGTDIPGQAFDIPVFGFPGNCFEKFLESSEIVLYGLFLGLQSLVQIFVIHFFLISAHLGRAYVLIEFDCWAIH